MARAAVFAAIVLVILAQEEGPAVLGIIDVYSI
jgi:hypothetical protein